MTKLNLPLSAYNTNSTLGCQSTEQIYGNKQCISSSNFCTDDYDCPKGAPCMDGVCQCNPNAGMYITLMPRLNVYSMGCSWDDKVEAAGCQKHEYGAEKICLLNYCSKDVPCFAGVCDDKLHQCVSINATRVPLPKPSHHISLRDRLTPPNVDVAKSEGMSPLYIILIAAGAVIGLMIVLCIIRTFVLCCSSSARWAFGARKGAVKLANEDPTTTEESDKASPSSRPQGGAGAATATAEIHRAGTRGSIAYPPTPLSGTTLAMPSPHSSHMSRAPSRSSGMLPPPSASHSPRHPPHVRHSFHTDANDQPHMVTIELQDQSGRSTPLRMSPPSAPPSPLKASYTSSVASSVVDMDSGVSGVAVSAARDDSTAGYTTIDLSDCSDHPQQQGNKLQTATSNPIRRSISAPSFAALGASAIAPQKQEVDEEDLTRNRPLRDSCTLPAPPLETHGWDELKAKQQLHRSSTTIPTLTMTPPPPAGGSGVHHPSLDHHQEGPSPRNSRLLPVPHPQQQAAPNHQPLHHSNRSSQSLRIPPPSSVTADMSNEQQQRTLRHFQSTPNMNKQLVGPHPPPSQDQQGFSLAPPRPPFAGGVTPRPRSSMMQRPLSTASVTPEARHLPPGFESSPIARSSGVLNS